MTVRYEWRSDFGNAALNELNAEGFEHQILDEDRDARVHRHSLGWVCAYAGTELVGFVNVAWDGGVHAFVLDTLVKADRRHRGIGTRLIAEATHGATDAGCEWLHVDFDDHSRESISTPAVLLVQMPVSSDCETVVAFGLAIESVLPSVVARRPRFAAGQSFLRW